jgi:hypothetical protein
MGIMARRRVGKKKPVEAKPEQKPEKEAPKKKGK